MDRPKSIESHVPGLRKTSTLSRPLPLNIAVAKDLGEDNVAISQARDLEGLPAAVDKENIIPSHKIAFTIELRLGLACDLKTAQPQKKLMPYLLHTLKVFIR
jgi:hypothetical protein